MLSKEQSRERIRLIAKVTIAHVATYMFCGVIFMTVFSYRENLEAIGMKDMDELSGLAVILGQFVRGILFGFVIWWIRDSIIGKRLGWLKLWAILVIVGIISVYAPAPGSIEGMIYLVNDNEALPASFIIGSLAEIMVQPLLFSIVVTFQRRRIQTPAV